MIVLLSFFTCYFASTADPTFIQQGVDVGATMETDRWKRRGQLAQNMQAIASQTEVHRCVALPAMPLPPFLQRFGLGKISFRFCFSASYGTRLDVLHIKQESSIPSPWTAQGFVKWPKNILYPNWACWRNCPNNKPVTGLVVCYTIDLNKILNALDVSGEESIELDDPYGEFSCPTPTFDINLVICGTFGFENDWNFADVWILATGGPVMTVGLASVEDENNGIGIPITLQGSNALWSLDSKRRVVKTSTKHPMGP
jgi:hypothetical protein